MGSGSLNAMGVFEAKFKPAMEKQAAIDLVSEAIQAGIFNDLGSGSNVDVCVITKDGIEYLRNHVKPNERAVKEISYQYPKGATRTFK